LEAVIIVKLKDPTILYLVCLHKPYQFTFNKIYYQENHKLFNFKTAAA